MKKLCMLVVTAFLAALLVPAAWAQTGSVKGTITDDNHKPIAGAVIEMVNKENGRKYKISSNKNGEIFSLGIAPGTYDVTITSKDGQLLTKYTAFPVRLDENKLDVDMAKEHQLAKQQGQAAMSEEQKKQIEAVAKENTKIQGLNEKLAAAKAASDGGNFDEAVRILTEITQVDATRDIIWYRLADAQRGAAQKATDAAAKKAMYESSLESYKKALALVGATPKPDLMGAVYNNMADSYAHLGQTEEAIKSYEQAAQTNPTGAASYYFNEGAVFTNTNKFKEANTAFDKSIQADPTKADAYYQKGANGINLATLNKEGKMVAPAGTEEAFNKYLELAPDGRFAEQSKAMLEALGAKVETSYGKAKTAAKKK